MPTDAQLEANRRNAQLSTGPSTPAGKARSAVNGLKHGLYSKSVVLPDEDPDEYNALLQLLVAEFEPVTLIEHHLVKVIADSHWRLQRGLRTEAGQLETKIRSVARSREPDPDIAADPELLRNFRLGAAFHEDAKWYNVFEKVARNEERLHRRIFRAIHQLRLCRKLREKTRENASSNPISLPMEGGL
jgi:hypothetical protein